MSEFRKKLTDQTIYTYKWTAHVDFTNVDFMSNVKARDLWQHKYLGTLPLKYDVEIPAHGVLMLRVTR